MYISPYDETNYRTILITVLLNLLALRIGYLLFTFLIVDAIYKSAISHTFYNMNKRIPTLPHPTRGSSHGH